MAEQTFKNNMSNFNHMSNYQNYSNNHPHSTMIFNNNQNATEKTPFSQLNTSIEDLRRYAVYRGEKKINKVFLEAVKIGIIRNVRLFLTALSEDNKINILNQAAEIALKQEHIDILKILSELENGITNKDYLLSLGIDMGSFEIVELLLKNGADVHYDHDSLLFKCCRAGDFPEIINLLIKYGINVETSYHDAIKIIMKGKHPETGLILFKYNNENPASSDPVEIKVIDDNIFFEEIISDYNNSDSSSSISSDKNSSEDDDDEIIVSPDDHEIIEN